jgi:hypothetical protein
MAAKDITSLDSLTPDDKNANRGTQRGRGALEYSLRNLGAGRSILVDREGRVVAGNKTLEVAAELGLPVEVVRTDGRALVVVQRTDLDLEADPRARELALADNRVGQLDLDWDPAVLAETIAEGLDVSPYWGDDELARLLHDGASQAAFLAPLLGGAGEAGADSARPDSGYHQIAFSLTAKQREIVLSALTVAKREYGVPTQMEALVRVCERFIHAREGR